MAAQSSSSNLSALGFRLAVLGLAALGPALGPGLGCGAASVPPGAPDIVILTLESLRTDHVGAYGGRSPGRPEVPITPEIDAFATRATVYEDAHSVTSWTLASHASLFTGLYPAGHRTDGPRDRLADSLPTLAEVLAQRGYQTAGVVSGPYLRRTHNLSQGFEHWDDSSASITNKLAHDDVTNPRMQEGLQRFLEQERDPERPFLLFGYFWDPHHDFLPPPPYDRMFVGEGASPIDLRGFDTNAAIHPGMPPEQLAYVLSQYAGEIRWTDLHVGRLFRLLQELSLWDNSVIVVTSDHGEEFFDHGEKGHKNNLYAETTRVPLIVKYPGQVEGRREARPVSLVDLLPTLLALTGGSADFPVHGRSLLAEPDPERALLYELRALRYYREPDGAVEARGDRWYAVRGGDWKLVWRGAEGEVPGSGKGSQLFQVAADPDERADLAAREPQQAAALRRRLVTELEHARRDAERYPRGGPAELSAEEIEQLRELGYLGP